MSKYQPKEYESTIRELWKKENVYLTDKSPSADKTYCLSMFPYPSGSGLHVGHVRIYTGTDVLARYFKLKGKSVLHPMGWDAFGLPAENAAIKAKKNPMDMVPGNIANFKKQMQTLGLSYDWEREFATTDPAYYRFTQWLFIQFFKMGLLYKRNTPIHFCPTCKTGLAEEEVLANGTHERCGKPITKKDLPQWIFRITTYADRLLSDLDGLDWPAGILEMQRNWIGRKEGVTITYDIVPETGDKIDTVSVFTTRPDTNFGATFVVLAPEHAFVKKITGGKVHAEGQVRKDVAAYVEASMSKSEMEREAEGRKKTGVFTGFYAVNQLTGRRMPVWVSDFVLSGFGTGAVVGVPGHDLRDFEFASEFGIDIIRVVVGTDKDTGAITKREQVQEEEGVMMNSGFLDGLDIHAATKKITEHLVGKGWATKEVSYHLRDWIFSRQRYWGEPIPMAYCETCAKKGISWWDTEDGNTFQKQYHNISKVDKKISENMVGWFPIPEKNLPLTLPAVTSYEPSESGESPLAAVAGWSETTCPHCQARALRETDTMPNWAGSCWYFLQFALPANILKTERNDIFDTWKKAIDKEGAAWLPVDWYLGGAEHAVLHLLYARFWVKALQDLGILSFSEPFLRLRNVGMVLAEDHRKMSKSLGNVINPDDVVAEYGADTLRVYEMFMAPFNQEISWSLAALQGSYRFLSRIWNIATSLTPGKTTPNMKLLAKLNRTIAKVGEDIAETKFNTAIAAMMEFLNDWEKSPQGLGMDDVRKFFQILSPFAPYLADKLWRDVAGQKTSVVVSSWPVVDQGAFAVSDLEIPVQINGKHQITLTVASSDASKDTVVAKALNEPKIQAKLKDGNYKVIYVPGKILNFVI